MLVPVLILVVITLFGKEKEDYKWFVLHMAILNLILAIIWEVLNFVPNSDLLWTLLAYILNLSVISIFPLAFTRFFFLYYRFVYIKIFTKKTIFVWILAFDLVMIGLLYIDSFISTHLLSLIVCPILILATIFCSFLIFLKIRNMSKLVQNQHNYSSYSDLQRAAFVCIWQSSIISIHLANSVFCQIFLNYLKSDVVTFNLFFGVYMVVNPLQYPMYQLFIIMDSFITLFLLKSYRVVIKKVCRKVLMKIKKINGNEQNVIAVVSRMTQVTRK